MPTLLLDSPRTTQRNVGGGAGGLIANRGNYMRHYRIISNFHKEKFLQFVIHFYTNSFYHELPFPARVRHQTGFGNVI